MYSLTKRRENPALKSKVRSVAVGLCSFKPAIISGSRCGSTTPTLLSVYRELHTSGLGGGGGGGEGAVERRLEAA